MRVIGKALGKLAWILAAGILAFGLNSAIAVDGLGIFELDGDAVDDGLVTGDDWSAVNAGLGAASAYTGVLADPAPETVFNMGGSKDVNDISEWHHKSGNVPDKDNITNAYAAAYMVDGDLVIYFGADRYWNEGTAQLGFWMFQDSVALNEDGTFEGNHQVGDILILVNYEEGGVSTSIEVLEWVGSGGDQKQGTLQLLAEGAAVECGSGSLGPDPVYCAIGNGGPIAAPWPYTPKEGLPDIFPWATFFEGGVNVSALFRDSGSVPCFATFLAETRSSDSVTAQLKDFVIGKFPVCAIEVEKTCEVIRLANAGDETERFFVASFSGEVTNTGIGTFDAGESIMVADDAGTPGDESDDIEFEIVLEEAFGPGDTVSFESSFYTDDNPPTNTVYAAATFGSGAFFADPYSIECVALTLTPEVSVTPSCDTVLDLSGDLVVVKVLASAEVCNTGDLPLSVTVTNETTGNILGQVELGVGECETLSEEYLPATTKDGQTDPGAALFQLAVSAVGASPLLGDEVVEDIKTTDCPLCP